MVFTETKVAGDLIMSSEQNAFVDFAELVSSQRAWSTISGAKDITWNTTQFDSSGIKWDDTTQKWIAVNVTAAGGGINNVVEDVSPQLGGDLDGQSSYSIYDITYVSSTTYSGSKLGSNLLGTGDTQAASGSHTHSIYDNLGSITWTIPTEGLGISLDATTGMVSGSLTIKVDDYIASSTAITQFAGSSNINRTYVDAVSSNLSTRINDVTDTPSTWGVLSQGTGISSFSVGISGGNDTVSVDMTSFVASSTAISRYADSANINTKIDTKQDTLIGSEYYPSSIGVGLSGSFQTHTSDSTIHFTKTSIDDDYAGSSNYYTHKEDSTIHYTVESIRDDFYPSSLGKGASSNVNTLNDWYNASAQNYSKAYASAQIAIYDAGGGISGWYDLDTGTGVTAFGGAVAISGTQAETLSVLGYTTISSNAQKAYASSQLLNDLAFRSTYSISGANDVENGGVSWDSVRWNLSGIKWSDGAKKWIPTTVTGGGGGLSNIVEDTTPQLGGELDGNTHGIYGLIDLSSQKISGGSIKGVWVGNQVEQQYIKSGSEYWKAYMSAQVAIYDAGGGISAWYDLSAGTGITPFGGLVSISGTQAETLSMLGYDTISANAHKGQASGALALYSETYSSENDLTYILNDNYPGSSNINRALIDTISGALDTKIDGKEDTLTKGNLTATSPIALDNTRQVIGGTAVISISNIPQATLKSGSEYWKAYESGQKALYSETYSQESDLTGVLNDNYPDSGAFQSHKADGDIHFPSSNLTNWLDTVYEPLGASGMAWSGASEYVGHSSNSTIHFIESSIDHTAISNIGTNSHAQIDTKLTDLFNWSTSAINLYGASSHNHPLSGLSDVTSNFNTNDYHDSGLKWNKATGLWVATQVAGGGGAVDNYTVKIDTGATADFIGATNSDGVLRVGDTITYADGGNYVTIGVDESAILTTVSSNAKSSYDWYVASGEKLSTISGSLSSRIDAISDTPTNWTTLTAGTGIDTLSNIGVSGSSPETVTILGYDTISANAYAGNAFSSNSDLFDSTLYIASSTSIGRFHPSASGHFAYISTQSISGVTCDDVKLNTIDTDGLGDLCTYIDYTQSPALLSGANITIGGPTGSINISQGFISIRDTNNHSSTIWQATIPASSNITLGEGLHYIYVDYNSGSPKYANKTTPGTNRTTQIPIGPVYNDWDTGYVPETTIMEAGHRLSNLPQTTFRRFSMYGNERSTGLVITSSQTSGHPLSLESTAGVIWRGLGQFSTVAQDFGANHDITAVNTTDNWFSVTGCIHTISRGNHILVVDSTGNDGIYIISSTTLPSSAGYKRMYTYQSIDNATIDGHIHDQTFTYYWRNSSDGWNNTSGQISLNPDNYDDGAGTLGLVGVSKYGIHWVYSDLEGDLSIIYGRGSYSLAEAQDATVPVDVPDLLDEFGILISRIIIERNETNLDNAEFATPWTTTFTAGSVDNHNDLGGLNSGDYQHLTAAEDTNFGTLTDNSDASALHTHLSLYPASGVVNKSYLDIVSSNAMSAYTWYSESSNKLSAYMTSGDEYSQAYLSAQIALYDEGDLTNLLDDNYVESGGTKWTDLTDGGETTLHTHAGMTTDVAWSGAHEFYVVSSAVKTLDTWYDNSSQKYSQAYASASTGIFALQTIDLTAGAGLTGGGTIDATRDFAVGVGTGITVNANDVEVTDYATIVANAEEGSWASSNMYTTTEVDTISGAIVGHVTNNYYTKTWIDSLSGSLDTRIDAIEADTFNHDLYITSSNAIDRFADSSNINSRFYGSGSTIHSQYIMSSAKFTTVADTTNDGYLSTIDWDTFNDKQSTLDGSEYYPSSLGKRVSSAVALNTTHRTSDGSDHTYIDQDVTNGSTPTFGGTNFTIIPQGALKSGSNYWGGYLSGQNINQSVLVDAAPTFTADNFSDGGSNAIITTTQETNFTSSYSWYTESSQKLSTFYASGDEYSTNYDWYNTNNSQLDNLLASGSKYSGWYGSGAQFATAYDHSQDNTQAHTDYLLNSSDDTMNGVLIANGFTTIAGISSNIISSQSIHGITPATYSIANIRISANQNLNICRFDCGVTQKAYIYQAYACCSSGRGMGDLYIEMLAGTTLPLDGSDTVYKTSSATIQQGNPLGESVAGDHVEIRFMYSGDTFAPEGGNNIQYGNGFMMVGVY